VNDNNIDKLGNAIPENRPVKVGIVIASTRPGRVGLSVGQWVRDRAAEHAGFEIKVLDLAEINLPFMDEPNHPRLRQYIHQHTKDWSAAIDDLDAFVFVLPEYNYGMTAPLKNALDFLSQEWQYKPVGLVSYGGLAGGTRAAQMLKQVVTALKMMPLTEAVAIPFVNQYLDDEQRFQPTESMENSLETMFKELGRWAVALQAMRTPVKQTVAV
jgi:NAD(P)H-dependent FMN reductase